MKLLSYNNYDTSNQTRGRGIPNCKTSKHNIIRRNNWIATWTRNPDLEAKTTDTNMNIDLWRDCWPGIAGCRYPKQRRPTPSLLFRSIRLLIGCTACTNYYRKWNLCQAALKSEGSATKRNIPHKPQFSPAKKQDHPM